MTIQLPRDLYFDIDNLPDDFDEQVANCFRDYTNGTARDYTYQDKLCFIDRTTELLHKATDADDAVYNEMQGLFKYEVKEQGNIPDESDYLSMEFMEQCYIAGKRDMSLYSHNYGTCEHDDEKVMKILCRIIKIVMEWEYEIDN